MTDGPSVLRLSISGTSVCDIRLGLPVPETDVPETDVAETDDPQTDVAETDDPETEVPRDGCRRDG